MYNYFENQEDNAMENRSYNADGNYYNASDNNFYQSEGFYNAQGMPMQQMAPAPQVEASQPFVISIANSTTVAVTNAVIFDANTATLPTTTNFGNSASITITLQNGNMTYGQLLQSLHGGLTFRVAKWIIYSTTASQPYQNVNFTTFDTFGPQTVFSQTPFPNAFQQQTTIGELTYPITVNGFTKLTMNILASATAVLYVYPSKVYNMSNGLVGRDVSMQYGNPNVSGVKLLEPNMSGPSTGFRQIGQ